MTWQNGRQLASLKKGNTQVTYRYDANGMRTSKTVRDTSIDQTRETKYYYDSDNKLIAIYGLFGNIMHFYYDGDGKINSMSYAGEMYYYVTNLQGDVTKLVKSDGTVAANYEYDAWGKLLSVTDANGKTIGSSMHIGLMNPLRYRGYVYDDETGLYYLQSRYYDPTTGRFLNADDSAVLNLSTSEPSLNNLFNYCGNNPIINSDPTGYWMLTLACSLAGAALFGGVAYLIARIFKIDGWVLWAVVGGLGGLGAILGAIFGVKFLTKVAPQLVKWFKKVERNTKIFGPNKAGNIIGIVLFNRVKIMIHRPHRGKHNFYHIQIEARVERNGLK